MGSRVFMSQIETWLGVDALYAERKSLVNSVRCLYRWADSENHWM